MEVVAKDWGMDRSVAWIGQVLIYLILLKASELFAEDDDGRVHAVYCLRGGDAAFYADERLVEGGNVPGVDTVEGRFRSSNGDQGRNGACW